MAEYQRKPREPVRDPLLDWKPKTSLGVAVRNKEINDIDKLLEEGKAILESEIVDTLLPNLETELLLIGQAKGKFGGGQRRVFKNTQKKTREGNKIKFTVMAVVGDKDGHIGIGVGSSRETVPSREKAIRQAKLNLFRIRRGSGSWESASVTEPHTIPFAVQGKCGSVIVRLMPAPKGKGLTVEKECAKILQLAGVSDVWSKSFGQTKNKMNMVRALEQALRRLSTTKIREQDTETLCITDGSKKDVKQ